MFARIPFTSSGPAHKSPTYFVGHVTYFMGRADNPNQFRGVGRIFGSRSRGILGSGRKIMSNIPGPYTPELKPGERFIRMLRFKRGRLYIFWPLRFEWKRDLRLKAKFFRVGGRIFPIGGGKRD